MHGSTQQILNTEHNCICNSAIYWTKGPNMVKNITDESCSFQRRLSTIVKIKVAKNQYTLDGELYI